MLKHKIFVLVLSLFWFVTDVQPFGWFSQESECLECDINFLTLPSNDIVKKMTTIQLECYIDKYPSDLIITWKKINPPSWPNPEAKLAIGHTRLIETE